MSRIYQVRRFNCLRFEVLMAVCLDVDIDLGETLRYLTFTEYTLQSCLFIIPFIIQGYRPELLTASLHKPQIELYPCNETHDLESGEVESVFEHAAVRPCRKYGIYRSLI
jgi:hypothetical protein